FYRLFDYDFLRLFLSSLPSFFLNDPAPTETYTLSLHDALPISQGAQPIISYNFGAGNADRVRKTFRLLLLCSLAYSVSLWLVAIDRKSTRLNSSHVSISYAVFCLKKKKSNFYTHI